MDAGYDQWLRLWPYAILVIVLGSWSLYRFLAPASWREWAGAGLLQAFIIALYAEMYGFPLTIYFLTSVLPLEVPLVHHSGHLWATLFGYGRTGAAVEMTAGYFFVVVGVLLITKGWIRVYYEGDHLLRHGVYGIVRHPQYTGIFLIVFGQLVHWPTIPTLALAPVIVWIYLHLAQREEARLTDEFGEAYLEYRRHVPMIIPRLSLLRHSNA